MSGLLCSHHARPHTKFPTIPANLQPGLDHRAARLQDARSGPRRSDRPATHGRVSADRCLKTVDRYIGVQVKCLSELRYCLIPAPGVEIYPANIRGDGHREGVELLRPAQL